MRWPDRSPSADHLVVVAGPGVVTVELRSPSGTTVAGSSRKVAPSARSPFQVADLPVPPPDPAGYRLVALDVSGQVVDRADSLERRLLTARSPGQRSQASSFSSHSRIGAMSQYSSRWCATIGSPGP